MREFINRVKEKAVGHEVNKSLTPGQEFVKIVRNELVAAMGEENQTLNLAAQPPAVVLMAGLQGAGKTTSVGKLGKFLREKHKKKVLVVSADVYRPAAIKQLETLAEQVGVDFFPSDVGQKPVDIVNAALKEAKLKFYDVLLVDTAGRLHVDEAMMVMPVAVRRFLFVILPVSQLNSSASARKPKRWSRSTRTGLLRVFSAWATCCR